MAFLLLCVMDAHGLYRELMRQMRSHLIDAIVCATPHPTPGKE
jgi:hypothetical protein